MNLMCHEPATRMSHFGIPSTDNIILEEEEESVERSMYISTMPYPRKCVLSCNGTNHDISNLISKEHLYRQQTGYSTANSSISTSSIRPTTLTTSATWSLGCTGRKSLYPNRRAIEDSTSLVCAGGGGCSTTEGDGEDEAPPVLRQWMSDSDYRYPNSSRTISSSSIPTSITVSTPTTTSSLHKQQQEPEEDEKESNPAYDPEDDDEEEEEEDFSMSFLYQLQKEQEQQRQAQQIVLQEEEQEQRQRQEEQQLQQHEQLQELAEDDYDDDDEEHPLLEISPGMKVPYIGTAERTRALIRYTVKEQRTTTQTVCFSCQACLVCMTGVQYVACIVCHTVSPLSNTSNTSNPEIKPRGAGIGLLVEEAELIKQQEARRSKELLY